MYLIEIGRFKWLKLKSVSQSSLSCCHSLAYLRLDANREGDAFLGSTLEKRLGGHVSLARCGVRCSGDKVGFQESTLHLVPDGW